MKKRILGVACVLVCSLMLVTVLSSCEESPLESKTLVVVNDSASAINHVSILQYVSGAKQTIPNALRDGETIAIGASKTFYLAPYAADEVFLNINNKINDDDAYDVFYAYFTYTYLVDGKNEDITVTFNTDTVMTGSKVEFNELV